MYCYVISNRYHAIRIVPLLICQLRCLFTQTRVGNGIHPDYDLIMREGIGNGTNGTGLIPAGSFPYSILNHTGDDVESLKWPQAPLVLPNDNSYLQSNNSLHDQSFNSFS